MRLWKSPLRWESLADRVNIFAVHTSLYRLLGRRLVGRNILILTTTGRKSGRRRSTPLFHVRDGSDYVIVASNGGEDPYPGWWHNIRADARVEIQVGRQVIPCSADPVREGDAAELWEKLCTVYGGYREYKEHTKRELTVFRLKPLSE